MADTEFDVVISGYGPTGQTAAALLARMGHRVCVFERWPSLYGMPRIATIDGESARIVQAACDVDAAFRRSLPRRRYRFANGDGAVLIESQWDRDDDSGFPYRISLHQPDLEDALDAAARGGGAEINQGWEVSAIDQDEHAVRVTARQRVVAPDRTIRWGEERTVSARYLVGADGARGAVREALGIEREAWPFRNAWYSVDARRKRRLPDFLGVSPDAQIAVIFCLPEGQAHSVIPLGRDHVRFNFEVDPDGDHDEKLNNAVAYEYLQRVYKIGPEDVDVYRQAVYPFEGRLAKTWQAGRAFLAGDAAHLMTPFLGQGGCAGFRDAINISWKLDLVLKGLADEALLNTYEAERLPHVRVHIDGSDKLAAIAFIADPEEAAERDRRMLSGEKPPVPKEPVLTDGILHRLDDGRIELPVGGLAPQGIVRTPGGEGRFDDVVGWGFQLLAWETDPRALLAESQLAFFERIGGVTAALSADGARGAVHDMTGVYKRFLDGCDAVGFLMRPDFVVFGLARTLDDVPRLVDDLRKQLGASVG